jgi:hypothetical protein
MPKNQDVDKEIAVLTREVRFSPRDVGENLAKYFKKNPSLKNEGMKKATFQLVEFLYEDDLFLEQDLEGSPIFESLKAGLSEHNLLTAFESYWLEVCVDSFGKTEEWSHFWFKNRNPNTAFTVMENGERRLVGWKDFSLTEELLKKMYMGKNEYTMEDIKENRLRGIDNILRHISQKCYQNEPFDLFSPFEYSKKIGVGGNPFYHYSLSFFTAAIYDKSPELCFELLFRNKPTPSRVESVCAALEGLGVPEEHLDFFLDKAREAELGEIENAFCQWPPSEASRLVNLLERKKLALFEPAIENRKVKRFL